MQYLKNYGFTAKEVKSIEENIPDCIRKTLEEEQKLVSTNLEYLEKLGIENYKEIFSNYYNIFLMDNSNFVEIFNKYDQTDLIDKLKKNVAIVEYL